MTGIVSATWCENCGVEILWGPIVDGQRYFCCQDCFVGLRCNCNERMEMDDDRRSMGSAVSETSGGAYQ